MNNYPDNIRDFTCQYCKEITPNCTCEEEEVDVSNLFSEALHGNDDETYYEMFNSADSDDVIMLIRTLHQNQGEKACNALIAKLDEMLEAHVKK